MNINYAALGDVFALSSRVKRVAGPNDQFLVTDGIVIVLASAEDATYLGIPLEDDTGGRVAALWEAAERNADRSTELMPLPLKTTGEHFDCVVLSVNGERVFWEVQERYIEPFLQFPLPFLHPSIAANTPLIAVFGAVTDALVGVIAPTSLDPESKEPARGIESLLMLDEVIEWHRERRERRDDAR